MRKPLENCNVKSAPAALPLRAAALALLAASAGCSWLGITPPGEDVDYRTTTKQGPDLEVPPDLTQLAREGRYQPRSSVVSANELAAQANAQARTVPAGAAAAGTVAPASMGDVKLERDGQARWLATARTPEQVWPIIENFWRELGFALPVDSPQTGTMETSWAENRAQLPNDIIRRTLGRVLDQLYSTGLRDRFRTRVERGSDGTDIYITHQGVEEVVQGQYGDQTIWQPRPPDPLLEAEMLSRLMLRLGGSQEQAKALVAAATPAKGAAAAPRELPLPAKAVFEIAEGFDRAWRQVGLALDRSGFTIEDRDRSAGLYFVRYVNPQEAGKEEPGFFAKLFSKSANAAEPLRYRVALKSSGATTTVSVQDSRGTADNSENARRIIARLSAEVSR